MSFYCPHCNTENSVGPEWKGMVIPCAACLRGMELQYRMGQTIPPNGYKVTFQDFCRLVNDVSTSRTAHPLIAQLLDCTIENYGNRLVLRHESGALIPFEVAHFQIQSDTVKQRRLYNLSMDLWR